MNTNGTENRCSPLCLKYERLYNANCTLFQGGSVSMEYRCICDYSLSEPGDMLIGYECNSRNGVITTWWSPMLVLSILLWLYNLWKITEGLLRMMNMVSHRTSSSMNTGSTADPATTRTIKGVRKNTPDGKSNRIASNIIAPLRDNDGDGDGNGGRGGDPHTMKKGSPTVADRAGPSFTASDGAVLQSPVGPIRREEAEGRGEGDGGGAIGNAGEATLPGVLKSNSSPKGKVARGLDSGDSRPRSKSKARSINKSNINRTQSTSGGTLSQIGTSDENNDFDGQKDAQNLQNVMGLRLSTIKKALTKKEFSVQEKFNLISFLYSAALIVLSAMKVATNGNGEYPTTIGVNIATSFFYFVSGTACWLYLFRYNMNVMRGLVATSMYRTNKKNQSALAFAEAVNKVFTVITIVSYSLPVVNAFGLASNSWGILVHSKISGAHIMMLGSTYLYGSFALPNVARIFARRLKKIMDSKKTIVDNDAKNLELQKRMYVAMLRVRWGAFFFCIPAGLLLTIGASSLLVDPLNGLGFGLELASRMSRFLLVPAYGTLGFICFSLVLLR